MAAMLAAVSVVAPTPAHAQQARDDGASEAIVYRPPAPGLPTVRVAGASRGGDHVQVQVFAPEHTGHTRHAQPRLYWFVTAPDGGARYEFSLIAPDAIEPLALHTLAVPPSAGVYSIDLATLGVELRPSIEYQWSVAAVIDEAQRSRDVLASARIRRVSDASAAPAAKRTTVAEAATLAAAGAWYDAADVLGRRLERAPRDAAARRALEQLARQASLELPPNR